MVTHVVNVVIHVVNVVICIQRGVMHRPTRLRRVGPRLARLRRAKRGVFCLPRYYALFPTPVIVIGVGESMTQGPRF